MRRWIGIVMAVVMLGLWMGPAHAAGPLTLEASLNVGSRTHDVVLDLERKLAFVATDVGLSIVDISNPLVPTPRSAINLGGKSYGLTRQGTLIFSVNQTSGLKVVDVANASAPAVVATKAIPYKAWDVAVKDDIVYVVSYAGEMYLFRFTRPNPPAVVLTQSKVIGLLAWNNAAHDAAQLTKMNAYVTSGNAKVTGVSVSGNILLTQDWAWGRLFWYDVTDADNPLFSGTYTAPFLLRVETHPTQDRAYGFAAGAGSSGIYNVPFDLLGPWVSIRHAACPECGYFRSPPTDYGGFAISPNGNYLVYLGGKQGVIEVVDITNPVVMTTAGSLPLLGHGIRLAESMGAAGSGDYIFVAAGSLGFRVYKFPGFSS